MFRSIVRRVLLLLFVFLLSTTPKSYALFNECLPVGLQSTPTGTEVSLTLQKTFSRVQHTQGPACSAIDPEIYSPKSVHFSADGNSVYINSLEGFATLVYNTQTLTRTDIIRHKFTTKDASLFLEDTPKGYSWIGPLPAKGPQSFGGKPVESALTPNGRYLFVPYYRRDFDILARNPSAMAIIDTTTNTIKRVMAVGPISKYVAISNDGTLAAVTHWGDNTVLFIDISSNDPMKYSYVGKVAVGHQADMHNVTQTNRDHACGYCLRGTSFTPDGKYVLVARMGGGGIAVIATPKQKRTRYIGTITGMKPTPRDIHVASDGYTYVSLNKSGSVARIPTKTILDFAQKCNGKKLAIPLNAIKQTKVGNGARTIVLTSNNRYMFCAVNQSSDIAIIRTSDMHIIARIPTPSYPVGMAISPDNNQLWITAQGRNGQGGHIVSVYTISYREP